MNSLHKLSTMILFVSLFLLAFSGVVVAEPFEVERQFGEFPQISVSKNQYPVVTDLLSAIEPIRVSDPYVTAGAPFVIEFTLENIGDELGYPWNQIPLTPDNYSLVLMADNQYDQVILPNGSKFDVWNSMTSMERFGFATQLAVDSFVEFSSQQLEGRSCGFVDMFPLLPGHTQDEITVANGGQRPHGLLNWSCIKLIDEPYFNSKVSDLCGGTIDSACLAEVNKRTYVGDTIIAQLTSTQKVGECRRPVDDAFSKFRSDFISAGVSSVIPGATPQPISLEGLGALGSAITGRMNIVECGIGSNGIQPGSSVTFAFVGLVPADTPVLSPAEFADATEINDGITQSASCVNAQNPENCHTIYAGVFPTAGDNFLKLLTDATIGNLIKGGKIIAGTLYTLDFEFTKDVALASGGITNQVVGEPIWEGRGIFFVVGAGLKGSINLILMLVLVTGLVTGASLRRRTGQ